jgi:hypothetical protein
MAEDEIIKHTKKAYHIFSSGEHGWAHKLREILVEIIIIVFAVSVSIWLHNWSESKHDQKEAKEFFAGLKKDLEADITNMTNSKIFYANTLQGIRYFASAGDGNNINQDSISKYSGIFFNSTDLEPHIARYEGLKSSGKFRIIENKELLNNIIDLHESIVQRIQDLNDKYYRHNEKLETLISQNTQLTRNGQVTNSALIVNRSDFKILLSKSGGLIANSLIPVHETGINKCNEIIREIDAELK